MKLPGIPKKGELTPTAQDGTPGSVAAPPIGNGLRAGPEMLKERETSLEEDPEVRDMLSLEDEDDPNGEFVWAIYGRAEED